MNATITLPTTDFAPGETIHGTVSWHATQEVRLAEVRLFWQTRGKGSVDVGVAAVETLDLPEQTGQRPFSFVAPHVPPGFSGKLISLVWGIEFVLQPEGSVSQDIVIAPGRKEISLDRPEWLEIDEPSPSKRRMAR